MKKQLALLSVLGLILATVLYAQGFSRVNRITIGGVGPTGIATKTTFVTRCMPSFDGAATAANTTAVQTVTAACTGARITDNVQVNPRSNTANLAQGECFVSAVDTVRCVYGNMTAAGIDPAAIMQDILVWRTVWP